MGKRTKAKSQTKIWLILLILAFLSGCANQLPPGGGEVDKIPPIIEEVYPQQGTINFDDDYINFDFSEYVEKRSFKEAVFISPQIKGELNYNWSGTSVSIEFPEKLKANTTYVVTIGTDVADVHNRNKMAQAFTLTFSTGNEIDKRTISGRVFDGNPTGVLIYAYKVKTDDSIDIEKTKPDYITQTGEKGQYKLNGIASGKYRVFAVRDKYKDFLFQPQQDEIGISNGDIIFLKNDTTASNINFKLNKIDTSPPRITKAVMTDVSHILVEFSESISLKSVQVENFSLIDSTNNKNYKLKYIYRKFQNKNQVVLINNNFLNGNSKLFLQSKNIKDENENVYGDDIIKLIYSSREDTTKPGFIASIPQPETSDADYSNQKFYFYFSDYFDSSLAKTGIKFLNEENTKIPFLITFLDDASFFINAKIDLLPVKKYKIEIDLKRIKNKIGSSADSIYVYNFTTINGLNFSGVSGAVKNLTSDYPVYMILQGTDKSKKVYKQLLNKNKKFVFNRILSGKYRLWCFIDSDKNGEYSPGNLKPYKGSEKFLYLQKELELRPRWMQTDIILELKN